MVNDSEGQNDTIGIQSFILIYVRRFNRSYWHIQILMNSVKAAQSESQVENSRKRFGIVELMLNVGSTSTSRSFIDHISHTLLMPLLTSIELPHVGLGNIIHTTSTSDNPQQHCV